MKLFLIIILSFSFTLTSIGQQNPLDSGFTNKAEAKNLVINGKKEGKWLEYIKRIQLDNIDVTNDTNLAGHYKLTIYRAGKPFGIMRQYYMSGKLMSETKYTNEKKLE
ncbi:MAG: hypothetical protein ACLQQ4_08600 [Bacteroidia bacterium]